MAGPRTRERGTFRCGKSRVAVLLLLAVAVGSCGSADWTELAVDRLDAAQQQRFARAQAARDALAAALQGRLLDALGRGGPVEALDVCAKVAPDLAAQVAAQEHVAIGRTSFALRNQRNTPPVWAATAVQQRRGDAAVFGGPAQRLGALFPIRLQPQCVQCHGDREALAEDVKAKIAALYPSDHATGFAAGDLRGWFWVEVP